VIARIFILLDRLTPPLTRSLVHGHLVGRYVERREHDETPRVHDLLAAAAEFGDSAVDVAWSAHRSAPSCIRPRRMFLAALAQAVVTAAVDAMKFRSPVKVGDVITLRATVNAAWRTSMEAARGGRARADRRRHAHMHRVPDNGRARRGREARPATRP
jgi:hypothetical protein